MEYLEGRSRYPLQDSDAYNIPLGGWCRSVTCSASMEAIGVGDDIAEVKFHRHIKGGKSSRNYQIPQ